MADETRDGERDTHAHTHTHTSRKLAMEHSKQQKREEMMMLLLTKPVEEDPDRRRQKRTTNDRTAARFCRLCRWSALETLWQYVFCKLPWALDRPADRHWTSSPFLWSAEQLHIDWYCLFVVESFFLAASKQNKIACLLSVSLLHLRSLALKLQLLSSPSSSSSSSSSSSLMEGYLIPASSARRQKNDILS